MSYIANRVRGPWAYVLTGISAHAEADRFVAPSVAPEVPGHRSRIIEFSGYVRSGHCLWDLLG